MKKPILENIGTVINGIPMEISLTTMAIDNHMVVIHVQVGKNIVEDILLDGGSGINIITE